MEDGELDFSNQELFSGCDLCDWPNGCSMDSNFDLDDLLKDTHACTHTHTCNPPGPDNTHTHTCYHVHTKLVPAPSDDKVNNTSNTDDTAESTDKKSKKRPTGNREAVRKYREKKKARAASLEEEVVRLRAINQQLLKRLQGQAALHAEVARLKCLLVDIRGRIEGEIGSFPYQKSVNTNVGGLGLRNSYVVPCDLRCGDQMYCLHPGMEGKSGEGATTSGPNFNDGDFDGLECLANQDTGVKELPGCGLGNGTSNVNSSGTSKKKGKCTFCLFKVLFFS